MTSHPQKIDTLLNDAIGNLDGLLSAFKGELSAESALLASLLQTNVALVLAVREHADTTTAHIADVVNALDGVSDNVAELLHKGDPR